MTKLYPDESATNHTLSISLGKSTCSNFCSPTEHSTTDEAPTQLLFCHKVHTKLPSITGDANASQEPQPTRAHGVDAEKKNPPDNAHAATRAIITLNLATKRS